MILARFSLMFALVAYGSSNSMSGTFQTCSLECSNAPGVGNHPTPTSDKNFRSAALLRGKSGPQGEKGKVGRPGAKGARGEKGLDGVNGPRGEKGNIGLPGIPGASGRKGMNGVKGLRGEIGLPGRDGKSCDTAMIQQLQDRLAELERESEKIKILKPQTCSQIKQQNPEATTGQYVLYDNIFSSGREVTCDMSSEGVCVGESTFTVTSKLSFDAARAKCVELGGDLLQNNFGPDGTRYHNEIRQIASDYTVAGSTKDLVWIGYTDLESEGTWKFLNGDLYDANNRGQSSVLYWTSPGEPSNSGGNEHCAAIAYWSGTLYLNDDVCSKAFRGLCEIKASC